MSIDGQSTVRNDKKKIDLWTSFSLYVFNCARAQKCKKKNAPLWCHTGLWKLTVLGMRRAQQNITSNKKKKSFTTERVNVHFLGYLSVIKSAKAPLLQDESGGGRDVEPLRGMEHNTLGICTSLKVQCVRQTAQAEDPGSTAQPGIQLSDFY